MRDRITVQVQTQVQPGRNQKKCYFSLKPASNAAGRKRAKQKGSQRLTFKPGEEQATASFVGSCYWFRLQSD